VHLAVEGKSGRWSTSLPQTVIPGAFPTLEWMLAALVVMVILLKQSSDPYL